MLGSRTRAMENSRETTITPIPKSSIGDWARSVRMALQLTQLELANMTGVSLQEVNLFEKNFPVILDTRRKLLKVLWAARGALYKKLPSRKK